MVYVITDGKSYITYNDNNGQTTTSKREDAKEFGDRVKANNYMKCLKKQLKKFHWEVKGVVPSKENESHINSVKEMKIKQKIPAKEIKQVKEDVEVDDLNIVTLLSDIAKIHMTIENLVKTKSEMNESLSTIDKEICDIMHYAEFNNLNACKGFRVYKMLQSARVRRRKIKDKLRMIDILTESGVENSLSGDIMPKLEGLKNRSYRPRVLLGLFN